MEREIMTREKVFGRLRDLGAKVALIEYHGGNDESFIECVNLYSSNREDVQYDSPVILALGEPGFMARGENDGIPDEDELSASLIEPIYDYIGEDFGDGVEGVDGTLVWYVAEEKVIIENGDLQWVREEREL